MTIRGSVRECLLSRAGARWTRGRREPPLGLRMTARQMLTVGLFFTLKSWLQLSVQPSDGSRHSRWSASLKATNSVAHLSLSPPILRLAPLDPPIAWLTSFSIDQKRGSPLSQSTNYMGLLSPSPNSGRHAVILCSTTYG